MSLIRLEGSPRECSKESLKAIRLFSTSTKTAYFIVIDGGHSFTIPDTAYNYEELKSTMIDMVKDSVLQSYSVEDVNGEVVKSIKEQDVDSIYRGQGSVSGGLLVIVLKNKKFVLVSEDDFSWVKKNLKPIFDVRADESEALADEWKGPEEPSDASFDHKF